MFFSTISLLVAAYSIGLHPCLTGSLMKGRTSAAPTLPAMPYASSACLGWLVETAPGCVALIQRDESLPASLRRLVKLRTAKISASLLRLYRYDGPMS